jgi:hypothetical protein
VPLPELRSQSQPAKRCERPNMVGDRGKTHGLWSIWWEFVVFYGILMEFMVDLCFFLMGF